MTPKVVVPVAIDLPAVAQALDPIREGRVVGDHGSAVAERAQILRRVEAEGARGADRADRPSRGRSQMRLAAVLDEREAVPRREALEGRHIGRLPVQVHGENRAGARPDRPGHLLGIEREPRRIDVGEHRPGADHHHGKGRVRRRQRRRDDLVAGPDPERSQDEGDRVGAGSDADGAGRAARRGELRFERFQLRAEHEPAAGDDALDGLAQFPRGIAFGHEREERNARHHRVLCAASTYREKCWR